MPSRRKTVHFNDAVEEIIFNTAKPSSPSASFSHFGNCDQDGFGPQAGSSSAHPAHLTYEQAVSLVAAQHILRPSAPTLLSKPPPPQSPRSLPTTPIHPALAHEGPQCLHFDLSQPMLVQDLDARIVGILHHGATAYTQDMEIISEDFALRISVRPSSGGNVCTVADVVDQLCQSMKEKATWDDLERFAASHREPAPQQGRWQTRRLDLLCGRTLFDGLGLINAKTNLWVLYTKYPNGQ